MSSPPESTPQNTQSSATALLSPPKTPKSLRSTLSAVPSFVLHDMYERLISPPLPTAVPSSPPPSPFAMPMFTPPSRSPIDHIYRIMGMLALVAFFFVAWFIFAAGAAIAGGLGSWSNPVYSIMSALTPPAAAVLSGAGSFVYGIPSAWCTHVNIGCSRKGDYAPFLTPGFKSAGEMTLLVDHGTTMKISLGEDIFDCMSDLYLLRAQEHVSAHLNTLADDLEKYTPWLSKGPQLSLALRDLGDSIHAVVRAGNKAHQRTTEGLHGIVHHYAAARVLAQGNNYGGVDEQINYMVNSTARKLSRANSYLRVAEGLLRRTKELHSPVASLANIELAHLRFAHQSRGITARLSSFFSGYDAGERVEAGDTIHEILRISKEAAFSALTNDITFDQCRYRIGVFKEELAHYTQLIRGRMDLFSELRALGAVVVQLAAKDPKDSSNHIAGHDESKSKNKVTIDAAF